VLDLLIKGGTIVDGTGAPARVGDVAVQDGRIVSIGATDGGARRTIDADGLVVAPGFVDLHTHYDAQLLWDNTASPSPLHGVTTVFGGNCGFALAPAGPEHADYLARLMARVEGIPLAALEAGVPWDWTTFAGYADKIEGGGLAINAGFLAGHSSIRRVVMGDDAVEGEATDDQIDAMAQILRAALGAGAMGFSSSQAPTHNDGDGCPVPSRHASRAELIRLASVLRDFPGTQLELILAGCLGAFSPDEIELMTDLSLAARRPLNWNILTVDPADPEAHLRQLDAGTQAAARGARVVALTLPQGTGVRLNFLSGFVLDGLPGWRETMALPPADRMRALADPAVRARLAAGAASPEAGVLRGIANWPEMVLVETFAASTRELEGRRLGDVAREQGKEPFAALLDVVVADELRTAISPRRREEPRRTWELKAELWKDPRAVVGASDAGAHLDLFCTVPYTTFLVGEAVRDRALLSIEEAVHLLTDVPARLYGLTGRGRVAPGWIADLVLFDPERVKPGRERTVSDLPGGASRLTADAEGVEHVLVGGTEVVRAGAFTDARPGTFLRSGRDTETAPIG
jgi:N-acyl-D-aspartate/D-glutamate deacylase